MSRRTSLIAAAFALMTAHTAAAQAPNEAIVDSPWPTWHGNTFRQASTDLPGPRSVRPDVQISSFEADAEGEMGTSPWHILSDRRYANSRTARTLWGVSLQYVYKYEVDGDRFRFVDREKINALPISIGWNFHVLADGRVLVPNTNGMRLGSNRECRGRHPSFLIYRDGATSDSQLSCVGKFEFSPTVVEQACGFRDVNALSTPIFSDVLHDGSIAARVVRRARGETETYIAVIDNGLTRIRSCTRAFEGTQSNASPLERLPNGGTRIYVPTDTTIVAFDYDPAAAAVKKSGEVAIAFRARTGTTPTLVETGNRRFLVVVDAQCAVDNVFRGTISCDTENTAPSALVAIPLPLGSGQTIRTELPAYITTVENSPAASGADVVVANYTGYTPDGPRDGRRERATGIVKLRWNEADARFMIAWERPDLQISGVPTISRATGLVYGSGSEPDRQTYFYGLRLSDGATVQRTNVGASYRIKKRAGIFDAGNNIIINDDGSAIWPGGESLVRIRDR